MAQTMHGTYILPMVLQVPMLLPAIPSKYAQLELFSKPKSCYESIRFRVCVQFDGSSNKSVFFDIQFPESTFSLIPRLRFSNSVTIRPFSIFRKFTIWLHPKNNPPSLEGFGNQSFKTVRSPNELPINPCKYP